MISTEARLAQVDASNHTFLKSLWCIKCKAKNTHQVTVFVKGNRIQTCYTCRAITKLKGGRP